MAENMYDANKIKEEKQKIRKMIWDLMEKYDIARFPRPVHGRIPNFVGAEIAAERITSLDIWVTARVVKANPDSPQKPLRYRALHDGKTLVMASPKLKEGFLLLDPSKIPSNKYSYASTIRGAFIYGRKISLSEIPAIDLVVTGSVAVDRKGGRIGKGGGYAELEYAILREIECITEQTPVVTTVHDIQVIDRVPLEPHDLTVDYIGTPKRLYKITPRPPKPQGIYWELLGDKIKLKVVQELRSLLRK